MCARERPCRSHGRISGGSTLVRRASQGGSTSPRSSRRCTSTPTSVISGESRSTVHEGCHVSTTWAISAAISGLEIACSPPRSTATLRRSGAPASSPLGAARQVPVLPPPPSLLPLPLPQPPQPPLLPLPLPLPLPLRLPLPPSSTPPPPLQSATCTRHVRSARDQPGELSARSPVSARATAPRASAAVADSRPTTSWQSTSASAASSVGLPSAVMSGRCAPTSRGDTPPAAPAAKPAATCGGAGATSRACGSTRPDSASREAAATASSPGVTSSA